MSKRIRVVAAVTGLVLVAAGCGSDRSGGPKGTSAEIVSSAARKTRNALSAAVAVAAPSAQVTGVIDFQGKCSQLQVTRPPRSSSSDAEPSASSSLLPGRLPKHDPKGVLDLLSAVSEVRVHGGAEVRGASTIRYELTISLDQVRKDNPATAAVIDKNFPDMAPVFPASVFIDGDGRIRRLQFPEQLSSTSTSVSRSGVNVEATTVDFFAFGTAVSCR